MSPGMAGGIKLEERLDFLAIGEADLELLAGLRPLLERHADEFVEAFYRHLLSFEQTRRLLSDARVKERLLGKQREYLLSLAGPRIDESYVADRKRIGEVHERVGLEPRWYLGAYALYFNHLLPRICERHGQDPPRTERIVAALVKVLTLDAQLAMEAYIERREAELEHLNRELATTSRGLAREVAVGHESLRRTERRARAAEELASAATLVAGLAHEIGTPLGVIRGHAEALDDAVEGERPRWRLRTIREQIDRISRIIQALLNIARPREQIRTDVSLAESLDQTLAFVAEKLRARSIQVERSFQPVAAVSGDPEKLQQLWLNLFLNAADAMPEGGRLGVTLRPDGPGRAEVRVSDTGVGIDPEARVRVFEPFYTTKAPGRGSGLGLVVAHDIVLDHGGQIELESEIGSGSSFRILLPIRER